MIVLVTEVVAGSRRKPSGGFGSGVTVPEVPGTSLLDADVIS